MADKRRSEQCPSVEDTTTAKTRRRFLLESSALVAAAALPMALPSMACGDDDSEGKSCPLPPAADGATLVAFDPEAAPEDDRRFPLALQVGALEATRALLVGYGDEAALGNETLSLKLWREDSDAPAGQVAMLSERPVTLDEGYFRAELDNLAPGHRYRYGLYAERDGEAVARSLVGRFRATLPAGCLEPVTLAPTSCTNMKRAPFPALSRLAREPIDAFCHLGDMSYNDGAKTVEEFRLKWRATLGTRGYRELLPKVPLYGTLDDHELVDNAKLYDMSAEERAAGLQAWFEHAAIPNLGQGRIWSSYRWGHAVEVFVLDCRNERRPETLGSDDPIYISKEQLAWLKQAVPASPCHFKVMLNSVPITELPGAWAIQTQDRWQGYAAQREELLAALDDVDNVWWLSGDFHVGLVVRLEAEGKRRRVWEILGGPGGNDSDTLAQLAALPYVYEKLVPEEQFDYFSVKTAATWLTFDPHRDEVRVRFADAQSGAITYDRVLSQRGDPRDPGSA